MRDKIEEILRDTLTTMGSEAVRGHEECVNELMQLMADKCAEAIHRYQIGGTPTDAMLFLGFTTQEIQKTR